MHKILNNRCTDIHSYELLCELIIMLYVHNKMPFRCLTYHSLLHYSLRILINYIYLTYPFTNMDSRKILHSHSYRIWSYWFWHESVSLMKVLLVLKMVHMRTTTKPRCCHRRFDCILIIHLLVHGLAHVHLLSIYPPTYFVVMNPTSKVRSANMREIWPNVVLRTPNVYNQLYMTYMYLKHFTYVSSLRRHRRQTRHKILNFARLQIAHTNDVTLQCTASWFRVSATQIRWVLKIQLQITPFSNFLEFALTFGWCSVDVVRTTNWKRSTAPAVRRWYFAWCIWSRSRWSDWIRALTGSHSNCMGSGLFLLWQSENN